MENTIGISLGSRLIGIVIFYCKDLVDCRMKVFSGVYSPAKLAHMIASLETLIDRYDIDSLVVKLPPVTHRSRALLQLTERLVELATQRGIAFRTYTLLEIKHQYSAASKLYNKRQLIKAIIERYSHNELLPQLQLKEKTNRNKYYIRIFEAIASVELAQKTGH